MMANGLKKLKVRVEGAIDLVGDRMEGFFWGGFMGAFFGFIFGGLIGIGVQDSGNEKTPFVNSFENDVEDVAMILDLTNVCDIDGRVFAHKGPNGDYTLYMKDDGVYQAQNERASKRFAEDFNDCVDILVRKQKNFEDAYVFTNYKVSPPLRLIDTNDEDNIEHFRHLWDAEDRTTFKLSEWDANYGGNGEGVKALKTLWAEPLKAFNDGDIYDHQAAKNVATMKYEDSYYPDYNWNYPLWGAAILALGIGSFAAFSEGAGSAFSRRRKKRAEKLTALDKSDINF